MAGTIIRVILLASALCSIGILSKVSKKWISRRKKSAMLRYVVTNTATLHFLYHYDHSFNGATIDEYKSEFQESLVILSGTLRNTRKCSNMQST